MFEASYRYEDEAILPSIRGKAWVCSLAQLLLDETDPFAWGIR